MISIILNRGVSINAVRSFQMGGAASTARDCILFNVGAIGIGDVSCNDAFEVYATFFENVHGVIFKSSRS